MARGPAIKAKISPPRLGGKDKVGLYSTRTPHRPNNIGLSLVRLEKVEGRNVYFLGADLIDMTPILDLKPYIPYADIADGDVKFPDWIMNPPAAPFATVTVSDEATARLEDYVLKRLKLYKGDSCATVLQLIKDVLIHDIRSGHQKGAAKDTTYELYLDNMKIEWVAHGDVASVESIHIASTNDIEKNPK
ncbi:hypothetical protein SARC_12796 [Sphaeroforma arctica JP610]|uniref:TsaA-like domain-containing protein n=1 Tax=Sphaeroforma arctica JP610 TaxID=667725 RepID=A0A0L0FD22_9EUKA|nr:hypothetical protein SARC_12796 [Sphaeroforma arctica JP610]KNC74664.1 hypothetical protein SARC_12796 [Sphaeroforma arctica JP610]|eukprot:XP_014148566.1 hypothetical protein SARC_12796 [Sphaeroforma arctica JP610]